MGFLKTNPNRASGASAPKTFWNTNERALTSSLVPNRVPDESKGCIATVAGMNSQESPFEHALAIKIYSSPR